jgi:hypothetical protein
LLEDQPGAKSTRPATFQGAMRDLAHDNRPVGSRTCECANWKQT